MKKLYLSCICSLYFPYRFLYLLHNVVLPTSIGLIVDCSKISASKDVLFIIICGNGLLIHEFVNTGIVCLFKFTKFVNPSGEH